MSFPRGSYFGIRRVRVAAGRLARPIPRRRLPSLGRFPAALVLASFHHARPRMLEDAL